MFEKQIEYFKNEYIVIAWDVPMHGLSVPYNDFSYEILQEIYIKY